MLSYQRFKVKSLVPTSDIFRHTIRGDWRLAGRALRYFWQRLTRGWDNSITWNLSEGMLKVMLPPLKKYREHVYCFPGKLDSAEEYEKVLDEIIWWMEYNIADMSDPGRPFDRKEFKRAEKASKLFGEYFTALWN